MWFLQIWILRAQVPDRVVSSLIFLGNFISEPNMARQVGLGQIQVVEQKQARLRTVEFIPWPTL